MNTGTVSKATLRKLLRLGRGEAHIGFFGRIDSLPSWNELNWGKLMECLIHTGFVSVKIISSSSTRTSLGVVHADQFAPLIRSWAIPVLHVSYNSAGWSEYFVYNSHGWSEHFSYKSRGWSEYFLYNSRGYVQNRASWVYIQSKEMQSSPGIS